MSEYMRKECKHIFSNGTEFELFNEQYCCKCSRYRNGKCRIYTAIIKAMFNEKYFPYKDLWEYEGIGGKGCKSFTEDHIPRKTRKRKEIEGQVMFQLWLVM